MANIVVIGAGLGGLPTVYELRHLLPKKHRVILISEHSQFTFIPGLIRVALNLHSLEEIQLDLAKTVIPKGIEFINGRVTKLDPENQVIEAGEERIDYDYLAIATGASLAFDVISGLGPHGGYTQSVCTASHALEAKEKWLKYLENPGDLVVGAMPGAGCFGPAYEFLMMADWELRKRGLRNQVNLTYITPEPYGGHLGVGEVKNAQELTQDLLKEKGIKVITNAEITEVELETITLADGQKIPFKYSMILPAFRGAKFLQNLPQIANSKGFVPILPTYCHPEFKNIYALGVAVELAQPEQTKVSIGMPKSAAMTEAMATAVAHNIAVDLKVLNAPKQIPTLESVCLAEYGDTGIVYVAIPVIPDPVTGKRRNSYAIKGVWVNVAKAALEGYFLLKMKWGLGMPWFERLGLRILFQVNISEAYEDSPESEIVSA
jgi:sulfide:quinone oxidoreductase